MATVRANDVAAHILRKQGEMTAMKLQKLVYYCQAWSLVWDERPLFDGRIEAWANGPVCPELYDMHRGRFRVGPGDIPGDPDIFDKDGEETIDAVLAFYGDKKAHWLSELTHREEPWRDARVGLAGNERGNSEIAHASMFEYYDSIVR